MVVITRYVTQMQHKAEIYWNDGPLSSCCSIHPWLFRCTGKGYQPAYKFLVRHQFEWFCGGWLDDTVGNL